LLEGAVNTLLKYGCSEENIIIKRVPGTFELTLCAQLFAENTDVDAVIALGCVIQGDTRHFDFICQSVTEGLTQLTITWDMPMIFGVLTTNTLEQAQDRCGGKLGNKGDEAAVTAIQMVALQKDLRRDSGNMIIEDEGVN
jgi:6,7-dimethyl-8-ribityllumazine synthase